MRSHIAFLHCLVLTAAVSVFAQETAIQNKIDENTSAVSMDRLKTDIETLVNFHNRNNFSDTLSNSKGIGAARRWILSEFEKINKTCNE